MSELYLVRHGQASFGSSDYDQLSEIGFKQSNVLGEFFVSRNIIFDRFVCGDMRRHRQTISQVCEGMQLSKYNLDILPGLNEYDFENLFLAYGKIFGDDDSYKKAKKNPKDKKHYYRLLRKILNVWVSDQLPDVDEKWDVFKSRVSKSLENIMSNSQTGSKALVIASGGSISMLLGLVLQIPDEKVFDLNLQYLNTGVTHFFFNQEKINLTGFNNISHLILNDDDRLITYG